jgi:hypothetical protein
MEHYNKIECLNCKNSFYVGVKPQQQIICPVCKKEIKILRHQNGENNIYFQSGCPAVMSDGRFLTNHKSTHQLSHMMMKRNGIDDHHRYRHFLQKNGEQIMKSDITYQLKKNTCQFPYGCSEEWNRKIKSRHPKNSEGYDLLDDDDGYGNSNDGWYIPPSKFVFPRRGDYYDLYANAPLTFYNY